MSLLTLPPPAAAAAALPREVLLIGEGVIGEPLDVLTGDKEAEALRAGKELMTDAVENEGMTGEWD